MAMTPEGKVKAAIKVYLTRLGAWFFMPIGGPYTAHGVPDIVGCLDGKLFGIECKAHGKRAMTTANQDRQLALITEAGGIAVVADCVSDVSDAFIQGGLL